MENSYRATNIALTLEWARFAEQIGVDIFKVRDAIRKRQARTTTSFVLHLAWADIASPKIPYWQTGNGRALWRGRPAFCGDQQR
ncbi:MAG: hypothetical protein LRZ88_10335 [Candidatus Cloacimonetes bacterium]|nr:hypothetical protein [Candidatus Cloacimonadota bacterium]